MGAHSIFGMSGQSTTIACPGAPTMSEGIETEQDNVAADKGTAVHDAGEFSFHTGATGKELVGMKFSNVKITGPMADCVDIYANQLREYDTPVTVTSYVEKRVCISSIDAKRLWGTGDYLGIDYINRKLYVADYKNGYVSVEINKNQYVFAHDLVKTGNAQVIGYALGALDTFNLWDKIDTIETCIIQPNKPHKDGPIRKQVFSISEMREWWLIYRDSHQLAISANPPRKAGLHCKYCKARGLCTTRIQDTMQRIQLDTSVKYADADQLIKLFEHADVMINSLKQIKDEAVNLSRKGHKVPDHKLVKAWKRASVIDEDELVKEALSLGKSESDIYKKELISKTDMKALLGNEFAHKHYKTPDAGLKLVPMTDPGTAQRPDRMSNAVGVFNSVTQ